MLSQQRQLNVILSGLSYRARRNWMMLPNRLLDGLSPQQALEKGQLHSVVKIAQHDVLAMQRSPRLALRMNVPRVVARPRGKNAGRHSWL